MKQNNEKTAFCPLFRQIPMEIACSLHVNVEIESQIAVGKFALPESYRLLHLYNFLGSSHVLSTCLVFFLYAFRGAWSTCFCHKSNKRNLKRVTNLQQKCTENRRNKQKKQNERKSRNAMIYNHICLLFLDFLTDIFMVSSLYFVVF